MHSARPVGLTGPPPASSAESRSGIDMAPNGQKRDRSEAKKWAMLARYYARDIGRRLIGWIPLIFFIISFAMFLCVMVPNLVERLRSSPALGRFPQVLELTGQVRCRLAGKQDEASAEPAVAARVQIGGYETYTDTNGAFKLSFQSQIRVDIPVVLSVSGHDYVRRFSVADGQYARNSAFVVP